LLSRVVARGILDAPETVLSPIGRKIEEFILFLHKKWETMSVRSYVIMPNHVHLLVEVRGASRMPRATDAVIPKFVSSLKRFTSRTGPHELWQTGYHDHIIRDDRDYRVKWEYIANNPARWLEDEYDCEEGAE
jgi:REP element-mobilizing transposase RayT